MIRRLRAEYLRNFVFGVEDSLVSTIGLLSGIAVAGTESKIIILTGIVLIFVEAFSMGIGSLLSQHSAEEYLKQDEVALKKSLKTSSVMLVSYFISGFIPLAPYLIFSVGNALPLSILVSLIALFMLGVFNAKESGLGMISHGFEMLFIGGLAIAVGVGVGQIVLFL